MSDKKMCVVSKQYYEEFYIFGIFTESELDSALSILAQESLNNAQKSRDELQKWYEDNHLPHYRGRCEYGCEHLPSDLSLSLIEYSKSLFTVSKFEVGEVLPKGVSV